MNKKCSIFLIILGLFSFQFSLEAQLVVGPQEAVPMPEQQPEARISLDLKGMDVVEALKTLAAKGNMNLVIGNDVRGRVTMFLKDVAVADAFEIILVANNLASEKKGDIIYVMPQKEYESLYGERYGDKREVKMIQLNYAKVVEAQKVLEQIKTQVGKIIINESSNTLVIIDTPKALEQALDLVAKIDQPTETVVFELAYSQAKDLSAKLNEIITKGVGVLQVDERTNKIIVTDLKSNIEKVKAMVSEFDAKPLQVLIDAKIVELTPSRKFYSGIDWDYWLNKYFRVQGAFNYPIPSDVTDKMSVGTIGIAEPKKKGQYTGIMDFLEIFGETKILSSPRILALNNQEAKILVGKKDAYITSTTTATGDNPITAQTVNFVDTGVKLYVTPTVNKDSYITLKIRPEISSYATDQITVEGQKTDVPIVTTSEAETTVIVKDGVSILIGGLRKVTQQKEKRQIPFLGRVPVLGFFFRGENDEWEKDELVIVLTPRIVSGDRAIEKEIGPAAKETIWESKALKEFPEDGLRQKKEEKLIDFQPSGNPGTSYKQAVDEKIKNKAVAFISANKDKIQKGRVSLLFALSRQGELLGEPAIISNDGGQELGEIAKQIVKDSAPFWPFPEGERETSKAFEVLLEF